jgi:formylglycine-generating enzyme required for sulfatase activity
MPNNSFAQGNAKTSECIRANETEEKMKPINTALANLLLVSACALLAACPQGGYRADNDGDFGDSAADHTVTTDKTIAWAKQGGVAALDPLDYPGDALYMPAKQQQRQQQQFWQRQLRIERLAGKLVTVPAGRFMMKPAHIVNIRAFKLGEAEVSQAQWRAVMGYNPSHFSGCDDCPVEQVSWEDIQDYLKKLNQQTGQRFRLPSEAEWEYACRSGGKQQEYCGGDSVDSVAWHGMNYGGNSGSKTHPVKHKAANGLGLYDMSGNVWEWVQDCDHSSWDGAPTDGSAWTSGYYGNCRLRILRGGSWYDYAGSGSRSDSLATNRLRNGGFRLAQDF